MREQTEWRTRHRYIMPYFRFGCSITGASTAFIVRDHLHAAARSSDSISRTAAKGAVTPTVDRKVSGWPVYFDGE